MKRQSICSSFKGLPVSLLTVFLCGSFSLIGCNDGGGGSSGAQLPWVPSKLMPGGGGIDDPAYRPMGLTYKSFEIDGHRYQAIDIETQVLDLEFDARAKTARATATISFRQTHASRPAFILNPSVQSMSLGGTPVAFRKVEDPAGNLVTLVERDLPAGRASVLEVTYELPESEVGFNEGGVGFLTNMTDLRGRFFEQWGPANYEDDRFALTLRMIVKNGTAAQRVFANGQVTQIGQSIWQVQFPSHYTSSSFYVHLTARPLTVKRFIYQGIESAIPITVYSTDSARAEKAAAMLPELFRELEADYGPYPHPAFIAYINWSSGGMEYVGATITSLSALAHELFHSWFARGVMPADGRSGWIDEALASWRDYGYSRSTTVLSRPMTNLARFSPFRRSTPSNSYKDGRAIMAEWDLLLANSGGLKPAIKTFFTRYRYSLVTTEEFSSFMQMQTGADLTPYFTRYVYNGSGPPSESVTPAWPDSPEVNDSLHPPPLTEEEVESLR